MKELIFVSSVQKELADERETIRNFVEGNRLLGRHFDVFIFEDLPAKKDPEDLVGKGFLSPGARRGAYYELPKQWSINGSIGSPGPESGIGSKTAQSAQQACSHRTTSAPSDTKGATKGPKGPSDTSPLPADTQQKSDKPDTPGREAGHARTSGKKRTSKKGNPK
jgi:hypothetical protein